MWYVLNSRMVLRSPMTSSHGSPRYFRSWLTAPRETNWKMRLSRPIVVWPSMTACGPTVVPAPMRTCGPMTVYGPISTDGSIWAPGSTMAVGWMAIEVQPTWRMVHMSSASQATSSPTRVTPLNL
jgi:hypothetical protein